MDTTVFDTFQLSGYTFLELSQGGVLGNTIRSEIEAQGVFKERNGRNVSNRNMETVDSDATIHIRPSEAFLTTVGGNTVGHGIRASKNGALSQDYRIVGQVEGHNFETGALEFYKLTLKSESLAEYNDAN